MKTIQICKTISIILLALYLTATTGLVYLLTSSNRILHAVVGMGTGLIVLWVFLGGALMYGFRNRIKTLVQRIPIAWPVKFIAFAVLLAMLEEAITTTLTNLAPLFGVKVGQVYITASANYLDVILHHSVIVFIPWFIAWAWILRNYRFSAFWVFLLFGLTGLLAESLTFGWQHLSEFAVWIFVYGLMVYLPVYTLPEDRGALPPKAWHALLAFLVPFLLGIPWAILIHVLFPNHPNLHFPPIQS